MQRLVLFDIDGTLLSAHPAPRRAFERAMLEVYGETGPIATLSFGGKTDPQIARELLTDSGFDARSIDDGLDALWAAYLHELRSELASPGHRTHVYPGVRELLNELAAREDEVVPGLLTGNIREGADLKLSSADLAMRFRVGAFGSDCEQRSGLPSIAVARAEAQTGQRFTGSAVVIVGDTPADVRCGEALGVHTVAVATGHHDRESLLGAGAAAVFDDFRDTVAVLDALLGG